MLRERLGGAVMEEHPWERLQPSPGLGSVAELAKERDGDLGDKLLEAIGQAFMEGLLGIGGARRQASHLLGRMTRRLSRDWQARYGHPIHLVETFVERDRFAGTSYRAAGWIRVGATTGRGRNGATPNRSIKEVWLRPLHAEFRGLLGA